MTKDRVVKKLRPGQTQKSLQNSILLRGGRANNNINNNNNNNNNDGPTP